MAITTQDVKLFKSERIDDTPEGGGRMTGNEVVDNQLNNLFDDTSRLDRVYGRVSLRKCFGAVTTANQDKFLGVHAIISDPPDDGKVAVTIVELNDHNDHRIDAKQMVEAYLVTSAVTPLTLYDSQPQGARTIIGYVDVEDTYKPPSVGDVLVLSVEKETDPNFGFQQFVRVDTVTSYTLVFLNRRKRVYTIDITSPLEITFPGADLVEFPGTAQRPTRVRTTDLNPAARYYGVVPLEEEASPGDSTLQVETILQPVVPASYSEAPVLDQQVGDTGPAQIEAGPDFAYSAGMVADAGGTASFRVPGAIFPGSATITLDHSNNAYDAVFEDSGDGSPDRISGGASSSAALCAADYLNATLSFTGLLASGSYTVTVLYKPAANFADVQHTAGTLITEGNRGFNYAKTAIPKPAPGTTRVRYRALGRWYDLKDNGGGQLTGADGTGAGTVNYLTGTINVTVGYQPDVGSYVLFGWATEAHYTQDTTPDALILAAHKIHAAFPVEPGSLSVEYDIGATTYTITDNGGGALSGSAATGTINYQTGEILAQLNQVPAAGTVFSVSYDKLNTFLSYTPSPQPTPDGSGDVALTLPGAPIKSGSARFSMIVTHATAGPRSVAYRDGGNGFLYDTRTGAQLGTINYTTGAVVAKGNRTYDVHSYSSVFGEWSSAPEAFTFVSINAHYQDATAGGAQTDSVTPTEMITDVSGGTIESLVSGSLMFTHNGRSYFDANGSLFRLVSGVPTNVGTFDAVTGKAVATSWATGARSSSLNALLTRYGRWPMTEVIWSTPGDPIRSGSFQVTDGTHTAISDNAGDLGGGGSFITGSIDYETGVYQVTFAPGIPPETGRYNAVVLTYLPLNPTILGLDPVRLPLSGTVPVLAQGDTLVIHNTVKTALPNPVVAGTTYALPRGNLAYAVLYDNLGVKIPTDRYTSDVVAGEVTFENPLDLSGYTQPLQAEHRIEDMLFCLDAQLSGLVGIVPGGLTHTFPVPGSYVSSAKLVGDLQATASEPFDQTAWTGEWSDELVGSEATGEYNDLSYPIEATNAGTVKERWRIEFTTSNAFRLIGEERGVIPGATGTIGSDFSPTNVLTGEPYFTIRALGWGGGWTVGNQLRFNTEACAAPLWLLRCTLQGPEEEPNDNVRLQFRGDSQ